MQHEWPKESTETTNRRMMWERRRKLPAHLLRLQGRAGKRFRQRVHLQWSRSPNDESLPPTIPLDIETRPFLTGMGAQLRTTLGVEEGFVGLFTQRL